MKVTALLTKENKNEYFTRVFKTIPDVVSVHADFNNNCIVYRCYMQSEHVSINVNQL